MKKFLEPALWLLLAVISAASVLTLLRVAVGFDSDPVSLLLRRSIVATPVAVLCLVYAVAWFRYKPTFAGGAGLLVSAAGLWWSFSLAAISFGKDFQPFTQEEADTMARQAIGWCLAWVLVAVALAILTLRRGFGPKILLKTDGPDAPRP